MSASIDTASNDLPDPADKLRAKPISQRLRRRRTAWTMSLNLTPMIDVVFLLLFFFLLTMRFMRPEGMLAAQLPKPSQAPAASDEVPREPIRIVMTQAPQLPGGCRAVIERLHPEPIPLAALAQELARIRRHAPGYDTKTPVLLQAGDDVAWEHVVNAYNAAVSAQYEHILFARPGATAAELKP